MDKNHLAICEEFYSIQGEGAAAGTPAVFLRLAGCNLSCKGFSFKHPVTQQHLGCDTAHVWNKGKKYTIDAILQRWKQNNWLEKLNNGAHLIITGGEPTLQQPGLMTILNQLDVTLSQPLFVEIETNATNALTPELLTRINQINASPKLSNNGDAREYTYKPEVIAQLAQQEKVFFKFVLMQPKDIDEIIDDYVNKFNINPRKIWLMPEGSEANDLKEKSQWIVELCKQHLMNYSPRLHIHIWGDVTGV